MGERVDLVELRNKRIAAAFAELHELQHVRCAEPTCEDRHWVCSCGEWLGSRILNDAANREEWQEHAEYAAIHFTAGFLAALEDGERVREAARNLAAGTAFYDEDRYWCAVCDCDPVPHGTPLVHNRLGFEAIECPAETLINLLAALEASNG